MFNREESVSPSRFAFLSPKTKKRVNWSANKTPSEWKLFWKGKNGELFPLKTTDLTVPDDQLIIEQAPAVPWINQDLQVLEAKPSEKYLEKLSELSFNQGRLQLSIKEHNSSTTTSKQASKDVE